MATNPKHGTILPPVPTRQRGAQVGNVNAMRVKPFERELRRFLRDKPKVLPTIIKKLAAEAIKGEQWATKEIREILDGKSVTPIAGMFEVTPGMPLDDVSSVQQRLAALTSRALERSDTDESANDELELDAGADGQGAGSLGEDDAAGTPGVPGSPGDGGDRAGWDKGDL